MQWVLAFMIGTLANPNFQFVRKYWVSSWNICLLHICKYFDICKLFCWQLSRRFRIKVLTKKALNMCSKWTILFVSDPWFSCKYYIKYPQLLTDVSQVEFCPKIVFDNFLFGNKTKTSWNKYLELNSAHHMVLLNRSSRIFNHHVLSWMI